MRISSYILAASVAAMMPAAALADDPNDPEMRSAAARAQDKEEIRQLNLRQLEAVRERDARYAKGWREYRAAQDGNSASHSSSSDRANADYARQRAQYEREMAEWRRAVAACRAGDYSACDN
jgi:hypothetical protein